MLLLEQHSFPSTVQTSLELLQGILQLTCWRICLVKSLSMSLDIKGFPCASASLVSTVGRQTNAAAQCVKHHQVLWQMATKVVGLQAKYSVSFNF